LVIATDRPPGSVLVSGVELGKDRWRWVEDTGLLFVTIVHPDADAREVVVG
jgi:hypothetical protein